MGYHYNGRAREYREGWVGRRRNYHCRKCGTKFQHDGFTVPVKARICPACCQDPANEAERIAAYEEARKKETLKAAVQG